MISKFFLIKMCRPQTHIIISSDVHFNKPNQKFNLGSNNSFIVKNSNIVINQGGNITDSQPAQNNRSNS